MAITQACPLLRVMLLASKRTRKLWLNNNHLYYQLAFATSQWEDLTVTQKNEGLRLDGAGSFRLSDLMATWDHKHGLNEQIVKLLKK